MARPPTFPRNVDLAELVSAHRSEDKCREYLEQLRWPDGVRCPRCDATKGISRIETRGQFECGSCGYQFSVRVGTIFQDSRLPLWKWFLAVYVMGASTNGVSANQLKRTLRVSYKTAWYLCHRIRSAMKDEAPELPPDVVDAGDAATNGRREVDRDALRDFLSQVLGIGDDVVETHPRSSAKHLPAYVDEMAFRHRNRGNAYWFRDILVRLLGTESLPYTSLIAGD